jgi:hypothetical protein
MKRTMERMKNGRKRRRKNNEVEQKDKNKQTNSMV